MVSSTMQERPVLGGEGAVPPAPAGASAEPEVRHGARPNAEESTIRLDVSVLDELMNLVGELVLARNSLMRSIARIDERWLDQHAQRIDLVTSELQARVLRTRMRPVRTVWGKLPRLVRETALTCGKEVGLDLEGEDTDLDKSVVEAIKDPMTHCVRNAVDHGIEPPNVRVALGKPREGRLHLRASHDNGQVVIEVSDDGRGIDPEKIRAKAVEKGLLPAEVVARLSDREVLDLIFAPGFSTAEKVTEVSGRGVGMDVVRTNVERIGGTVSVSSVLGRGSTFTFTIPLTLAIIPALLVGVGDHRFAVPQTSLVELIGLSGEECEQRIEDMHGVSVHRLRGHLLPIIDGAALLTIGRPDDAGTAAADIAGPDHPAGAEPTVREPSPRGAIGRRPGKRRLQIAVLRTDAGRFGLIVDSVLGTEEIVVKPIGPHYSGIGCFAGATILGDGVVSLILDVPGLAHRAGVSSVVLDDREGDDESDAAARAAEGTTSEQYVIVMTANDERHAVALDRVARLEKFPREAIESVGTGHLTQYRGGLLPLVSLDGWLDPERVELVTVVLADAGGEVGLVVDRVLDVIDGTHTEGGSIVLAAGQATAVVDLDRHIASCRSLSNAGW